ncbi:MAG TPA: alpha/beta fold hydrolase [Gemmataceae bacterium]|jgi:hypothetical protein|nr:alpha/beta fold hydrolase [Gemmataceae bacterium]
MLPANANHIFRPLPFLTNGHVQTIVGFFWKGQSFPYPSEQRLVALGDGDQIALHDSVPPEWKAGDPIVLLIHGLGGDHRSRYLQRTAALFYRAGVRPVRMDLRGSGASFGLSRAFYHAGRTGDLRETLEELHRWSPNSPLWVVGFSLGGHLILRMAGEPDAEPVPNLERMAAVSPPIDLIRCWQLISRRSRRIYDRFFANLLAEHARVWCERYPDPPLPEFPKPLSLRIFDDLFTAPRNGFADAIDYYQRCSSVSLISNIRVPTLILTARDDPFVAVEPFEELDVPPHIRIEIQEFGGHLGFLGRDGAGGVRWMEQRVAHWLLQK